MYLHKENRELFRDAILLTSQKLEVSEDIVEKDYYVTLILKKLSAIEYPVVFKGGTSLSKAFQVIGKEDISLTCFFKLDVFFGGLGWSKDPGPSTGREVPCHFFWRYCL